MEGDVAQTDLTIRIDDDLKASGEVLFRSLGTSYATVINALIKQAVQQGRVPFDLDEQEPLDAAETEEDDYVDYVEKLWNDKRNQIINTEKNGIRVTLKSAPTIDYHPGIEVFGVFENEAIELCAIMNVKENENPEIIWTVSDPDLATITSNGTLIPKKSSGYVDAIATDRHSQKSGRRTIGIHPLSTKIFI
jgi:addiction module RelB/DinJ family antitoxin